MDVKGAVSIQMMVRSDLASSGVAFTLDPDTGFRDVVVITGSYGLGESVVGGKVDPDETQVSISNLCCCMFICLQYQLIFNFLLCCHSHNMNIPGLQANDRQGRGPHHQTKHWAQTDANCLFTRW